MKPTSTDTAGLKIALLTGALGVFCAAASAQQVESAAPEWRYATEIYAWLPTIETTDHEGNTSKITLDDILKNLDFTAMLAAAARRGNWSIAADVVYMDLSKNTDEYLTQRIQIKEVQLESWVASPTVGYTVYADDRHVIDVFTGARYLWVKVGADLRAVVDDDQLSTHVSDSGSLWDGVVGVRGENRHSQRLSSLYSFSGGTGDSKSTWQANVSLDYKFDAVSAALGWRYLTWNLEDDAPVKEMTINGPYIGAIFRF